MPTLEDNETRWIYAIQSGPFVKIGVATSIARRMHKMRLENPHGLTVIYRQKMRSAVFHCEKKMHEVLRDKAVGREWFADVTIEEILAAAEIGIEYAKGIRKVRDGNARKRRSTFDTGKNGSQARSIA